MKNRPEYTRKLMWFLLKLSFFCIFKSIKLPSQMTSSENQKDDYPLNKF